MTHSPLLLCSIGLPKSLRKKGLDMLNLELGNAGSIWREPEGKNIVSSHVYVLRERVFPGLGLEPAGFQADYHADNGQYAATAALITNSIVRFQRILSSNLHPSLEGMVRGQLVPLEINGLLASLPAYFRK